MAEKEKPEPLVFALGKAYRLKGGRLEQLSAQAKALLFVLADRAGMNFEPNVDTLAHDASVCRKSVSREIAKMVALGVLTKSSSIGRRNVYTINEALIREDAAAWTANPKQGLTVPGTGNDQGLTVPTPGTHSPHHQGLTVPGTRDSQSHQGSGRLLEKALEEGGLPAFRDYVTEFWERCRKHTPPVGNKAIEESMATLVDLLGLDEAKHAFDGAMASEWLDGKGLAFVLQQILKDPSEYQSKSPRDRSPASGVAAVTEPPLPPGPVETEDDRRERAEVAEFAREFWAKLHVGEYAEPLRPMQLGVVGNMLRNASVDDVKHTIADRIMRKRMVEDSLPEIVGGMFLTAIIKAPEDWSPGRALADAA